MPTPGTSSGGPLSNLLVMTATVKPPTGAPELARVDPALRMADYCEALRFYAELVPSTIDRVIFIENTEADLAPLRAIAAEAGIQERAFFMTFDGNSHPPAYGKGYGEFKLMDHGLAAARDAGFISGKERLWKVTGRLRVKNLAQMIRTAPRAFDLYADFRKVPAPWLELRFFGCTLSGYDLLFRGKYDQMRDDRVGSAEVWLFHHLMGMRGKARIWPRFLRQPTFLGRGGRLNNDLTKGKDRLKHHARRVSRVITPWIWI